MHNRLAKQQLSILGIERKPLRAARHRRRIIPEHLIRPRDEGIQLANNRIGRCRTRQASFEIPERLIPLSPFDRDRAQIKQGEGVVRPLGKLLAQNAAIPLKLPGIASARSAVSRMPHGDICPFDRHPCPFQRRQNLLMNPIRPPHAFDQRKQSDVINDRVAPLPVRPWIARTPHDERRHRSARS